MSFLLIGCGGEIYYLDSFNYSQSGEATYETKELESENLEGAFTEAYEIIADEIISVYSDALNKDNSLGGVDNEIKALEFLNQALFNYEIFTVNREKMSKSIGNIQLVNDILKKYSGNVIRLSLLSSHYRQPMDWSEKILDQSKKTLTRFNKILEENSIKTITVLSKIINEILKLK